MCLSVMLPFAVNAETMSSVIDGENSTNANAVVGEVDTPIYEVEVTWNSFQFDWKYNSEKGEYAWEVGVTMNAVPVTRLIELATFDETNFESMKDFIYDDEYCVNKSSGDLTYNEVIENHENYYYCSTAFGDTTNHFHIGDYSTAGRITPYVKWTSAENYEYVQGKFEYMSTAEICEPVENAESFDSNVNSGIKMYSNSTCTEELPSTINEYQSGIHVIKQGSHSVDLTTEKVPDDGRHVNDYLTWYHLSLHLENKNKPATFPKAGDTIGTITITIKNN